MLVGTHNSASYNFDFSVSFWDKRNKWEWLRLGARAFPCVKEKLIKLSKTQRKTIGEQLEAGVRVLDLRVSFAKGTFYTSHTFCTGKLEAAVNQIIAFLEGRDPTEDMYIILLISPDFENQGTMVGREAMLLDRLLAALSTVLSRIHLVYRPLSVSLDYYRNITNYNSLDHSYYDVSIVDEFKAKFGATEFGDESILHGVLTPPTDVKVLEDISIERYAAELNPVVSYLLKQREAEDHKLPDACLFDFFDTGVSL